MRILYANKLIELSVSDDARIAWIRRNKTPSTEGEAREFQEFLGAIARLPAAQMAVIIDTRDAPGRNDAEFEHDILPQFYAATDRFARTVMLVRTEVGRIQTKRIARERGAEIAVFTDEDAARRHALGQDDEKPPR